MSYPRWSVTFISKTTPVEFVFVLLTLFEITKKIVLLLITNIFIDFRFHCCFLLPFFTYFSPNLAVSREWSQNGKENGKHFTTSHIFSFALLLFYSPFPSGQNHARMFYGHVQLWWKLRKVPPSDRWRASLIWKFDGTLRVWVIGSAFSIPSRSTPRIYKTL